MAEKNYLQEGFHQGLKDGGKVSNKKELERTIKDVYSKSSPGNALEYMTGYFEGFSKSYMASINE